MGAQSSTSQVDILNTRISEIVTNNVTNCRSMSLQTQEQSSVFSGWLSVGDINLKANMVASFDINCALNASVMSKNQNDITDAIMSSAASAGVSALPSFGNATSNVRDSIHNIVQNSVNVNNVSNNYSSISQAQKQSIVSNVLLRFGSVNVTADQDAKIFAQAVVKSLNDSESFSAVKEQLQQSATATSANPLDFITRTVSALFSGATGLLTSASVIPIAFIIMIVVGLIVIFRSASGGHIARGIEQAAPILAAQAGPGGKVSKATSAVSAATGTTAPGAGITTSAIPTEAKPITAS